MFAGKSSLTVRLCDGVFVDSYYPTIENTFSKILNQGGSKYAMEIVDTAGTVKFPPLTPPLDPCGAPAPTGFLKRLAVRRHGRVTWVLEAPVMR